jgi:peptide/nickel transport system permease protein
MFTFAVRRAISGAVLIASLTFLTFLVFNAIPTSPACLVVACGPHTTTNDAAIRAADHQLGIDRPIVIQYAKFVSQLLRHGSFGSSWTNGKKVGPQIAAALPVTASLVAGGMILMLATALALGCFSALRPRSLPDRGLLAVSVIGLAVHPFVLGIGLRDFFARHLGAPSSSYCPIRSHAPFGCAGPSAWAAHLAVPWIVFALLFLPLYMRLIRARLLETLNEPWISTARAKGASEPRVLLNHALRNAIGPALPLIAIDAGTALTAAIYIETVFGLPGLGHLAVQAFSGETGGYDLPLTAALVTTVGAFVVVLNLLADLAGAWIDPRTRLLTNPKGITAMAITARPRIRLALAALVLAAVALTAFQIGQHRTPASPQTAAAQLLTVQTNLVDSFDLSRGVGPRTWVRTHVTKLEVKPDGWRVYASITNKSNTPIPLDQPDLSPLAPPVIYPQQGMSLVVAPSQQQRAQGNGRHTISPARFFNPAIPHVLAPHQTWAGSFAGTDTVPHNRLIYIGFGRFNPGLTRPQSLSTSQALTIH